MGFAKALEDVVMKFDQLSEGSNVALTLQGAPLTTAHTSIQIF